MALTDTAIRTSKPRDKLYRLADAHGLCLEVTQTGSKLWRVRYRFEGKAKMLAGRISLGHAGPGSRASGYRTEVAGARYRSKRS